MNTSRRISTTRAILFEILNASRPLQRGVPVKRKILRWPLVGALLCVFFGGFMLLAHIRPTLAGDVLPISEQQALTGGIGLLVVAGLLAISAFLFGKSGD